MTRKEALAEAQRRWGKSKELGVGGKVFDRGNTAKRKNTFERSIKSVGRYWVGKHYMLYGNGRSWEEAFADATRRESEAKETQA